MNPYQTTHRRAPRRVPVIVAAALALVAAACGDDDTSTAVDPDTGAEVTTVTVMTHDSFAVSDVALADFEDATGYRIELLPSGDAVSALNQAILTKDDPVADVFFGVDNNTLSRALDAELFDAYASPGLDDVADAYELDPEHRATPIDVGDVCLNVDRAAYDDGGPATLQDLTDERLAGDLVVENPATSSPGLAFMLATIAAFGEDGWLDYWAELRANDVLVVDGWEDAYYGHFTVGSGGEGDRPVVVSYASSPAAEVVFAEEELTEAPTLAPLETCYRQIEFAGILTGTDEPDGARAVIDFLLSEPFQSEVALNMFVFPVTEVDLPPEFVAHADMAPDPYALDPAVVDEHRDRWVEEWTETVLR